MNKWRRASLTCTTIVKDNSTMKDGGLPSIGIPYVVVNGTIVVKDSKVLKDVYPGKPIRRPVVNE